MENIKFHQDDKALTEQIELAQEVSPGKDRVIAVTVSKTSAKARKSFYGFHTPKAGTVFVGDIQTLEDGTVRRIEAIINPS